MNTDRPLKMCFCIWQLPTPTFYPPILACAIKRYYALQCWSYFYDIKRCIRFCFSIKNWILLPKITISLPCILCGVIPFGMWPFIHFFLRTHFFHLHYMVRINKDRSMFSRPTINWKFKANRRRKKSSKFVESSLLLSVYLLKWFFAVTVFFWLHAGYECSHGV